jgi:hypothetical protein
MAEPGLRPMSPVIVVEPVFVIVEPARTANDAALPKLIEVGAATAD